MFTLNRTINLKTMFGSYVTGGLFYNETTRRFGYPLQDLAALDTYVRFGSLVTYCALEFAVPDQLNTFEAYVDREIEFWNMHPAPPGGVLITEQEIRDAFAAVRSIRDRIAVHVEDNNRWARDDAEFTYNLFFQQHPKNVLLVYLEHIFLASFVLSVNTLNILLRGTESFLPIGSTAPSDLQSRILSQRRKLVDAVRSQVVEGVTFHETDSIAIRKLHISYHLIHTVIQLLSNDTFVDDPTNSAFGFRDNVDLAHEFCALLAYHAAKNLVRTCGDQSVVNCYAPTPADGNIERNLFPRNAYAHLEVVREALQFRWETDHWVVTALDGNRGPSRVPVQRMKDLLRLARLRLEAYGARLPRRRWLFSLITASIFFVKS